MVIEHQMDRHRFVGKIDGHEAELTYRITASPQVWDYNHTYTPHELRGRGIAEKITQYALDYARAHDIKVIPGCPYVKYFFENHPEYQDVMYLLTKI